MLHPIQASELVDTSSKIEECRTCIWETLSSTRSSADHISIPAVCRLAEFLGPTSINSPALRTETDACDLTIVVHAMPSPRSTQTLCLLWHER
jgi:hypothetical protein